MHRGYFSGLYLFFFFDRNVHLVAFVAGEANQTTM